MFLANKLNKGGSLGAAPDPQFNYVTMLLHGDGTNGAQNNTFLDSSTNNFTITRNGNTTQGSFSPYGSNWSNYFDGSNYVSIPSNAAFAFGTGDFTVEGWIFYSSVASNAVRILATAGAAANCLVQVNTSSQIDFYDGVTTTTFTAATTSANTWTHIAVSRSGTSLRAFINGTQVGSAVTNTTSILSTQAINFPATTNYASTSCYLSNVRYVKGTAVYTSSFTPSTTPLTAISGTVLLTCQSNRFIDNSSNAFVVTPTTSPSVQRFNPFGTATAYSTSVIGGSGYFDGSGDYLVTPSNSAFNFGTGDFQIEAWVYVFNVTDRRFIYGTGGSGIQNQFWIHTDRKVGYYDGTDRFSTTAIELNSWNQVALARSGSTCTFYVNGVSSGTFTSSVSLGATSQAYIGSRSDGFYQFTGYMSDLRILKGGTSVPSGNPTTPLTNITNTSLLFNYTNGAIFDNAMMNDLETVGNAQISTSVKKYGTGSIALDGTGDFLKGAYNPWLALGTGDYTIEMWVNFNSVATTVFFGNMSGTGAGDWAFFYNSSVGVLRLVMNNNATVLSSSSWTPSTGTWYQIAICRASGTYRFFVNGTVTGSGSDSTNISYTSGNPFYVGSTNDQQYQLNGYMDDIRITKGYARYTANFTAPTAAFSNTGPV